MYINFSLLGLLLLSTVVEKLYPLIWMSLVVSFKTITYNYRAWIVRIAGIHCTYAHTGFSPGRC